MDPGPSIFFVCEGKPFRRHRRDSVPLFMAQSRSCAMSNHTRNHRDDTACTGCSCSGTERLYSACTKCSCSDSSDWIQYATGVHAPLTHGQPSDSQGYPSNPRPLEPDLGASLTHLKNTTSHGQTQAVSASVGIRLIRFARAGHVQENAIERETSAQSWSLVYRPRVLFCRFLLNLNVFLTIIHLDGGITIDSCRPIDLGKFPKSLPM